MSDITFTMMMIINTFLFLLMSHPLSKGLILLLQTLTISLLLNLLIKNAWFSFILFLIMIGGMLILFIYMTSIASNEKFQFKPIISFISLILIMMIASQKTMNFEMMNFPIIFNNNIYNIMSKFFNTPHFIIMLLMISYLFITLIAIVKIINLNYGPLRQLK